jgi:2-polyprenyl-3-methyl-5-hydroxy-6-metoxy-1,4-benzoquinol methylase
VAGCCDPCGCDKVFGPGFARRMAKRYGRRGLDATAVRLVDYLADRQGGFTGATVLDIGGGVGEIGLELIRRGAASVTTVELSPAYDAEARRLATEAGAAEKVRRVIADIAATPDAVETADLVVLHRVVCCYPDYERLLGAAADRCRDRLAFSHPPRNPVSRAFTTTINAMFALIGRQYRSFAHRPEAMLRVLNDHGLRTELTHRGRVWQVAGLARSPS